MRNSVLDSYAILAFLFREKGSHIVSDRLKEVAREERVAFIAAPNWAEVRYRVEQKLGSSEWSGVRQRLLGLPLEVVATDQSLAEMAGEFKVIRKMSLVDCFAAALAKQLEADILTGDPEFRAVEKEVRVVWL